VRELQHSVQVLKPGDTLRDYEIVARIRSGGMAALYLAKRRGARGFEKPVAIKVIHPHLADNKSFVRMFVDEAKLCAKIQDPHVVHVEELGEEKGSYFLAMEYVHGCSLAQLLRVLAKRERRLSAELAVYIAAQAAAGLHAAHETRDEAGTLLGVVHRDVSPQNVLVAYRGHVKIIDFGIAKARGSSRDTTVGSLRGKLGYMPPEQAFGRAVDRRTDVYALGVVLWEMLTMQRLFDADNELALLEKVRVPEVIAPRVLVPEVTEALDRAVMAALAPAPDDRPATALELRRLLVESTPGVRDLDSDHLAELVGALAPEVAGASLQLAEADSPRLADEQQSRRILDTLTRGAPGIVYELADHTPATEPHPSAARNGGERSRRGAALAALAAAVLIGGGVAVVVSRPPSPAAETDAQAAATATALPSAEPVAVEPSAPAAPVAADDVASASAARRATTTAAQPARPSIARPREPSAARGAPPPATSVSASTQPAPPRGRIELVGDVPMASSPDFGGDAGARSSGKLDAR
jgi:serine/threonine-protein kinase